jgi:hypothetical protein
MQGPPLSSGQPQSSQQQMMMNPQRTLVTVVTNAEPLPLEQKLRQNDSSIFVYNFIRNNISYFSSGNVRWSYASYYSY